MPTGNSPVSKQVRDLDISSATDLYNDAGSVSDALTVENVCKRALALLENDNVAMRLEGTP